MRYGDAMDGAIFGVAFLDANGNLIKTVSIPAATVTTAAQLAEEIASKIDAADFFLTASQARPARFTYSPSEVPLPSGAGASA